MNRRVSPTLVFSSLGHLYTHLFTSIFAVVVLTLEQVWRRPYHDLIALWTVGSLLVGAGALPAGMLSDRVGPTRMMVVFFLGAGASAVLAGLAGSPLMLLLALSLLGVSASIYHPVGIPWLVQNTPVNRGRALGFNGIFGSLGTAAAGMMAGVLIDLVNWRAAFMVPGAISMVTGLAMIRAVRRRTVVDGTMEIDDGPARARGEVLHALVLLAVTMFLAGIIYHGAQTALPKLFAVRFGRGDLTGGGALNVGLMVAGVYGVAAFMQLAGGYLADRYPLKRVYVGAIFIQIPALWLLSRLGGVPLIVVATLMVMTGAGALPAENMLVSRYAPPGRHGLAFGLKFVLAFGAAPLAVGLVAAVSERTGGVFAVFLILTALAGAAFLAASLLPGGERSRADVDVAHPPELDPTLT